MITKETFIKKKRSLLSRFLTASMCGMSQEKKKLVDSKVKNKEKMHTITWAVSTAQNIVEEES